LIYGLEGTDNTLRPLQAQHIGNVRGLGEAGRGDYYRMRNGIKSGQYQDIPFSQKENQALILAPETKILQPDVNIGFNQADSHL
jgi:hypothetical protein